MQKCYYIDTLPPMLIRNKHKRHSHTIQFHYRILHTSSSLQHSVTVHHTLRTISSGSLMLNLGWRYRVETASLMVEGFCLHFQCLATGLKRRQGVEDTRLKVA